MNETTAKLTVCIDYKSDGNTAMHVQRPLFPFIEDNGHAFSNLAYRHHPDKANPHLDLIDIYKIENGFAVKVDQAEFSEIDRTLDRHIDWNNPDSPTVREKLQYINDNPLHDLCTKGEMRATNALILMYSLSGKVKEAEAIRSLREERIRRDEERRRERIAAARAREAEEKAREQARRDELTADAESKLRAAKGTVSAEQILLLAERYGITVHPKTVHNIRTNVIHIIADGSSLSARKDPKTHKVPKCDGIFSLFHQIKGRLS